MQRPRVPLFLAAAAVLMAACGTGGPSGGSTGCSPSANVQVNPSPPPAIVGGRITLTEAQDGAVITVPAGTVVQLNLVTTSYGPWSVPASSDPQQLQRLSGSSACDGTATATFRANGSGHITARRGNREVTQTFSVSIVVSS